MEPHPHEPRNGSPAAAGGKAAPSAKGHAPSAEAPAEDASSRKADDLEEIKQAVERLADDLEEIKQAVERLGLADRKVKAVSGKADRVATSYWRAHRPELAPKRGFGAWKLTVSAFALAGVAMIGALCAFEGGNENVATSGSSGATLLKDSTQPAHVRSEEQSIDLAQAPPDDVSPPGDFAPAAAGAAQPRPGVSGGSPAAATVNTPVAAPPIAAPPPTASASQFPDPETVRAAASLGPDGTPIATRPASGTDSGEAAQANDAAKPPAKPAPEAASETGAIEQPSTPKLDAPTKLSKRASAHVVVASTDTTSPSAAMEPAHVRSEEQSIDLAQAPPDDVSPPGDFAPAAAGAAQPRPGVSGGSPAAATVNTPVAAPPIAAPPPTASASQFPDPETVRAAASLGPDGTPIATRPASGTDSGEAAQANDAAKPPAKPAPEAASETGAIEQPSTPKLDAPTKLSKRASAHVVVASTDTTSPSAAMETPSQPLQLRAPAKPKKAARAAPKAPSAAAEPQAAQAAAEPQAAPQQAAAEPQAAPQVAADPLTAPPVPHTPPQEPANPLARAFGELGALAAPATSTRQPVESTPATSSGWAVQLAASKSETEAKSDAARLNARYASALNGAAIGVHKARANVATGYRLRVVGLSKADAAALCARLKGHGGDCFILRSVTTLISTSP